MATFQLAGLPSLQIENQTAGGLGLPTVPQYAERPNTGVMLAQGLGAISERLEANKQQHSEADFMKSLGTAYAANDRDAMKQLAAAHPEQIERIQKGMGFIDQDRNQMIGQAAMDLRLAAKRGDQSLIASLQKNVPLLGQFGLTPEEVFLSYKQDPQQFDKMTDLIHLHADPKSYFDVQDKQEGRNIDRNKLAETERSNRAGETLTMRGQYISGANALTAAYAPTAAMQNYRQYAEMLQSDPDAAMAFANAAGINTVSKKLMKVEKNDDGSVTKYYTDGSEETGKINQPIAGDGIKPISLPHAQSIIDKANEGSKKAAGFALRLKDSMDSMHKLGKKIDTKRVALINRALGEGAIANLSLSPVEQQYMVNARDALYAILRPETGAAITLPEMQEYAKMYLPQPGDSTLATETKMKKMQGQYNALRGQSGRVYDALVVSSAAHNQRLQSDGRYTSKSGIQFKVE